MSNERLPLWNALNINIRSSNHLEGWHNRLDKNAGGSKLRFYRLLQLLMEEADCTISRCFDHHFRLKLDKQNILVTTPAVDTLEQFLKALILSLCDASNATSMFDRTVISTSVKRYKGKSISSA
ncbi:hypothetical protein T02_9957 [Trichinella nativa]|uniref:Uncharacterized protein n=1 Tax=Trichinella nativa TaxID=6335 RepID=A0A0V1L557_9BILA|nr:hypothetical protein T02_9957 [Trichinella nativa]